MEENITDVKADDSVTEEKPPLKKRIKSFFKKLFLLFFNPHFLICFGIAWMITNGWSYAMMAIGAALDIGWMIAVSGAYLAFLWLPISPEKIVTFAIAIFLIRLIFPNDVHTLGVLRELLRKAKHAFSRKKNKKEG